MNMDIDMYSYPHDDYDDPTSFHFWPCGRSMRVYSLYNIGNFHPHDMLADSLQFYHPLPYPYTWYVYGQDAAVVNIVDLQAHQQAHHQQSPSYSNPTFEPHVDDDEYTIDQTHPYHYSSESIDETVILQDLNMNQINESFEQASEFVACSGLSNKLISKNMKVTEYHHEEEEEESEVCVVCQVEFQDNERVGVLQCRHRFHPQCIKEWLLRKNLCPLCKGEALKIS